MGGYKANRIILGGFSQGAALALYAALTYDRPLAGVVSIAGWEACGLVESVRHLGTPILICQGTADALVQERTGFETARSLKSRGVSNVRYRTYQDLEHT